MLSDSICSFLWSTNFMWSTACMYECSLIYKLSGLNLPSQWPFLGYSMFTVTSLKKYWISKKKSQVNNYVQRTLWSNCQPPSCCWLRLSHLSVHMNLTLVKCSLFFSFYFLSMLKCNAWILQDICAFEDWKGTKIMF